MTEELEGIPPIVKALAEKQGMHPISWLVAEDHVTIVFAEGPKIRFDRKTFILSPRSKPAAPPPSPVKTLPKAIVAPVQKLPARRRRK